MGSYICHERLPDSLIPNCCVRFCKKSVLDFIPETTEVSKMEKIKHSCKNSKLIKNEFVLMCNICLIDEIKDVVKIIKLLSYDLGTDDIVSKLTLTLRLFKYMLSDEQISLISKLNKKYGRLSNEEGFCITLLWSSIVHVYINYDLA